MKTLQNFPLYFTLGITVLVSSTPAFSELESDLLSHPIPKQAAFYKKNTRKIEELRSTISDIDGEGTKRLDAIETLAIRFPEAAIRTAGKLTSDPSMDVSRSAVRLLGDSIAMSSHLKTTKSLTPLQQFRKDRYEEARKALRNAIEDPRQEIREIAAGTLASHSDREALTKIQEGIKKGLFSETEAVNYFGLAKVEIGTEYMRPYLDKGEATARAAAASYMGTYPSFQSLVRDRIFLSLEADMRSRVAAGKVLGQYDKTFPTYGLKVISEPNISPQLHAVVVDGYLNNSQAIDFLKPTEKKRLLESIEKSHPRLQHSERSQHLKQRLLKGQ